MAEANLIVTFDPTKEESAKKEITEKLAQIKEKGKILKLKEGLAEISVSDSKKTVKALSKLKEFNNTNKWIPVEKWCDAKIPAMQKCVNAAAKGISSKDKWKIEIGLHRSDLHEKDLIMKLTEGIDNPNVDLEKPTKIVKVEIVDKKAGISLLNKDEIFNTIDKK